MKKDNDDLKLSLFFSLLLLLVAYSFQDAVVARMHLHCKPSDMSCAVLSHSILPFALIIILPNIALQIALRFLQGYKEQQTFALLEQLQAQNSKDWDAGHLTRHAEKAFRAVLDSIRENNPYTMRGYATETLQTFWPEQLKRLRGKRRTFLGAAIQGTWLIAAKQDASGEDKRDVFRACIHYSQTVEQHPIRWGTQDMPESKAALCRFERNADEWLLSEVDPVSEWLVFLKLLRP